MNEGQLLAVIDAPDLDQQVTQAKATVDQTTASLVQAQANLGKISRVSGSLDSSTRTLLTEVQVPTPHGRILPGMYATVQIAVSRALLPALIPGDAIVTRASGALIAVVDSDNTVHYHAVQLGRDYGLEVEVTSGLRDGQIVVVNPTDDVRDGVKVKMQFSHEGPASTTSKKTLGGAL